MYIPKYYLAIKAKIRVNAFPTSEHARFVQTMTPRGRLGAHWGGGGRGLWKFSIRMNRGK